MTTHRVVEVLVASSPYHVAIGHGLLGDIAEVIELPGDVRRVLVVTQQPVVDAGHVAPVEAALRAQGLTVTRHVVPNGERAKDVTVLHDLWQAAARQPLARSDLFVAIGGGVVGDLAGFAAATYNRGVGVLQVPTTLLAQVDAAIGGKTGINLAEGKNLVGAFHQPIGVICDVAALETLEGRTRVEGFGEIVKYGFIRDPELLDLLEHRPTPATLPAEVLADVVERSVAVKATVVAGDERESGARAFLNFGHTVGHAIETLTGYDEVLHGEAVAMGMMVALHLGVRLGVTPDALVPRAEGVLSTIGLPTRLPRLDREAIWSVMARDKKAVVDGIRFVLLAEVGQPVLHVPSRDVVDDVLDELTTS